MTTEGIAGGDRGGPARKRSPLFTVFFVVVAVLIVVGGVLLFQRRAQYQALANETEAAAIPTVAIIHPSVEAGDENLVLPGTLQAYVESPIYARTNGYLRKWYRDIGSRVNKGELLADIDTPEVDQQLGQARADLNTAQANAHLSDITATRYTDLLKTDGVSKQEVDNAMGDQAAKRATVQSSEANVRRLEELESFKHIYAPFSGVLTQRNIDIGTLINAGNGGTSQQLFYLAQTDPIRVYVNVPEPYAPSIHPGIGAYLELTQYPGEKFRGKVVRTSNAIDLSTRTLLTEVDVPNASGLLLPGGYAQVHLEVTVKGDRLQVPVNSLLFRSEGLRAVVVDANHKARLQTLTIGRDYGVTLEVLNGLKSGDWIVLNPPDSLNDGQEVHVKEVPNPMAPAPAAAPAPNQTPKLAGPPAAAGKALMPLGKRNVRKRLCSVGSLALVGWLAGCTVGPNYKKPAAPVPAKWDVQEPFREAAPKDAVPKTAWWTVFHDDELTGLESDLLAANQTLKVSLAHYQQARASAAVQNATLFPTLGVAPTASRQRYSGDRATGSSFKLPGPITQSSWSIPFTVSYEVDLVGQRRRTIEAAQASLQANAADLENVRLILTAELAADYFSLRQLDTEIALLLRTVDTLQKGLDLVNSRHQGGVASGLDVAQEETLLNATRTQATLLKQQRKQFEDAIAVLIGRPAPDFHLVARELFAEPPNLDASLPSDLLERRPDIAEAERAMAVANAQIGIAKAAYYPSLQLYGQGGWNSAKISQLLNAESGVWAIGANLAESIFTGGARRAQVQFSEAGYDATVAGYRGTVLGAFQEVQDNITGLEVLHTAQESQAQAVDASRRQLDIATSRYVGGLVSYLDVVSAQQNLLSNEQEAAIIHGQRLVTAVLLVKALGGGWDAASLAAVQEKPHLKDIVAP